MNIQRLADERKRYQISNRNTLHLRPGDICTILSRSKDCDGGVRTFCILGNIKKQSRADCLLCNFLDMQRSDWNLHDFCGTFTLPMIINRVTLTGLHSEISELENLLIENFCESGGKLEH